MQAGGSNDKGNYAQGTKRRNYSLTLHTSRWKGRCQVLYRERSMGSSEEEKHTDDNRIARQGSSQKKAEAEGEAAMLLYRLGQSIHG